MKRFYCGVDLHSSMMQVCVRNQSGRILLNQQEPCDLSRMLEVLMPYRPHVEVLVESTHNWYWLVDGLQESGISVVLAHAFGVYAITHAKVKTDRKDARTLAELLRLDAVPEAHVVAPELREHRDLLRRRRDLVHQRATLYTSIRMQLMKFNQDRFSLSQIKQWDVDAAESLSLGEGYRLHIRNCIERIKLTSRLIKRTERHLLSRVKDSTVFQSLHSIPGIGDALGMTIAFESGDLSRFESVREYASYCRLVPGIAQSAGTVRRGRGSKQGNANLKWAYTQAAVHAARLYPAMRKFRDRHLSRRNHKGAKTVANCILGHKIARTAYALMLRGGRFDETLFFRS